MDGTEEAGKGSVLTTIIFLMVIIMIVGGCVDVLRSGKAKERMVESILQGDHQLRKMAERVSINSSLSSSFFLFVGSTDLRMNTGVDVKFAWKMNDGTYAISSMPIEKIRVRFDEGATTPTITFHWRYKNGRYRGRDNSILQQNINSYVEYAVLTIRESDWPADIHLPLNKAEGS